MLNKNSLCVSNLGWNFKEQDAFRILEKYQITDIEISPVKALGSWEEQTKDKIKTLRKKLNDEYGTKVVSLQSIFYGKNFNLFHNSKAVIEHLKYIIDICTLLDVKYIVFGSPSIRKINNLSLDICDQVFYNILSSISQELKNNNIFIGIETNPKVYGCEYLTKYSEYKNFSKKYCIDNIKFHFDLSCVILEDGQDMANDIFNIENKQIEFLHLSKFGLGELTNDNNVKSFLSFIKEHDIKNKIFSLEMLNLNQTQFENSIKYIKNML